MASVPYSYECSKDAGFVPDPNEQKRVGYITTFKGLGLAPLTPDLTIFAPFTPHLTPVVPFTRPAAALQSPGAPGKLQVVGVMEKFEWEGGVGDPVKIDFYVSQENATLIKNAQQSTLQNTRVDSLSWWIIDYDQETKRWYEQCFPTAPLSGQVGPRDNPELNVDLTPVPSKDGVDVNVYKISIQIAPAANQPTHISMASSSSAPVVKQWGLEIGALAAQPSPSAPAPSPSPPVAASAAEQAASAIEREVRQLDTPI